MLCVIQLSAPFHLTRRQRTCCQGPCFHSSSLCHPLHILNEYILFAKYCNSLHLFKLPLKCHCKEKLYQKELWLNSDLAFWGCFSLPINSSIWVKCHIRIYMYQQRCAWTYRGGWYLFSFVTIYSFLVYHSYQENRSHLTLKHLPFPRDLSQNGSGQPPQSSQKMHGITPRH